MDIEDKSALILVDLQVGFTNDETSHLIGPVTQFLTDYHQKFDLIVITQFYNHEEGPFYKIREWQEMVSDSDCALWPELEETLNNLHLSPPRFKKSACSGWCDELEELLKEHNIKSVYSLGVDTEVCLLGTAIDAFDAGFKSVVLSDYCASSASKEVHEAALTVLRRSIGEEQVISD